MKTALIVTLFALTLLILWRLNVAKRAIFALQDSTLHIQTGDCSIKLPSFASEEDFIDSIDISRYFLKLPNEKRVVYEIVDLPSLYAFAYPTDALIAKMFGFTACHIAGEKGRVLLIEGVDVDKREFAVVAAYESEHTLQLLYPLENGEAEYFKQCLIEGKKGSFPQEPPSLDTSAIRPKWDESGIIRENTIEKDM